MSEQTKRNPLLTTKLYIPPARPALVPRPHLTGRLDAALHRKLTLISAPAGFGKTTLLSEWAAGCKWPIAWLSLDEGDNDSAQFWAYFIAALQTIPSLGEAGVGEATLATLQSPQPLSIEPLLTGLINEIAEIPDLFALVLDDYHVITDQWVNDGITFLLDNLPPQMHLILSGRADPPWPLARLRARGEMTELRVSDLRFTSEEATTFLNKAMRLDLSLDDVVALQNRTEGWIVGLQMAALSMRGRKDVSGFIKAFSGSHRFILDYLMEEVLDRQSAAIQDFLLRTSILERMTGSLCDSVTGGRDSQTVLTQLEQANLFLIPLDDRRRWYRYHHLFADSLRSQLNRLRPEVVSTLHHRASVWFEEEGLVAEAIQHALAAGNLERAANLVEKAADRMVNESKISTLLSWLASLPATMIFARPWLCVCHAWASLLADELDAVEPLLQTAEAGLSGAREVQPLPAGVHPSRIRGQAMAIRAYVARAQGDVHRSIQLSEEASRQLPEDDLTARSANALNLGLACWMTGDLAGAGRYLEQASETGQVGGNLYAALAVLGYLGELRVERGHLRRAAGTCEQAIRLGSQWGAGQPLPATGHAYVGLGQVLYEWNDLDGATRHLTRGIELGELGSYWIPVLKGYLSVALLKQARGQVDAAMEQIERAEEIAPSATRAREARQISSWKARLWLAQGDLNAAAGWADSQAPEVTLPNVPDYPLEFQYLTLVRIRIAQREADEIPALLDRLRQAVQAQERMGRVIEILTLQALALATLGKADEAIVALQRALSLAEPEGYIRTFVEHGAPMGQLLRQAAARGIRLSYAGKLLAALKEESDERGMTGLVEPLTEREMEVLRLLTTTLSTQEIAVELFISVHTVRSHIKGIYRKLNVGKRIGAIQRARELGLL